MVRAGSVTTSELAGAAGVVETLVGEADRLGGPGFIDFDLLGNQAFGEADAFLEGLGDFLVIEGIAGGIDQAAAIGDGGTTPGIKQVDELWAAAFFGGFGALVADGAGVGEEFLGGLAFLGGPLIADERWAVGGGEFLIAAEEFFDLDDVVGERFGAGVDGGEAAADDDDGHADLEVGEGLGLGRAGELEGHEEIGGLADAAGEAVLHRNNGRTAGSCAQRDVIEAHVEGAVDGEGAAETDAAEHAEFSAAFEEEADDLEKIFVPADGDAVLGDASEAGVDALIKAFVNIRDVADGAEGVAFAERIDTRHLVVKGFDFEAIDGDDGVAIIHEVVGEGESGGTKADDENFFAGIGDGNGPHEIEGVPAGEEAVDFEAPGELEHVLEGAGFGLRNIDRFLLLIDAGFHAVVADAVAGAGAHGVIDGDNGQRSDRVALTLDLVHLRDLLVEGAAGEGDAERGFFVLASLFLETLRTTILGLMVALDAVGSLVERALEVGAGVGEMEAFAVTPVVAREGKLVHAVDEDFVDRHEMQNIDLLGELEEDAVMMFGFAAGGKRSPSSILSGELELRGVFGFRIEPERDVAGETLLGDRSLEEGFKLGGDGGGIDRRGLFRGEGGDLALHEFPFDGIERRKCSVPPLQFAQFRFNVEQLGDEVFEGGGELDQEVGLLFSSESGGGFGGQREGRRGGWGPARGVGQGMRHRCEGCRRARRVRKIEVRNEELGRAGGAGGVATVWRLITYVFPKAAPDDCPHEWAFPCIERASKVRPSIVWDKGW